MSKIYINNNILIIFIPFALGHFISFFFRSVNSVLTPYIEGEINLSITEIGLLSSAYFLTFAMAQLPVGICIDKYGPKKTQVGLLLIATIGTLIFSFGTNFITLFIGRAIIGLGLSACFMAAVKAITLSFDKHRIPMLNGYMIAVGGLGAMASTMPVNIALHMMDWRILFYILTILTFIIMLIILTLVPNTIFSPHLNNNAKIVTFNDVLKNDNFRKAIKLILLPHTVAFGLQGLWLGQWLHDVGHFSAITISNILFVCMAGIVIGAIFVGKIGEWASRKEFPLINVAGIGIFLFIIVQIFALITPIVAMPLIAVSFTLIGTIGGIEYTIVSRSLPKELTGRASTLLNLFIFTGSFLIQTAFGAILSLWKPINDHIYPPNAYRLAFIIMILFQLPGLFLWLYNLRSK